jgi:outer membrane lipoprotein-sorting protein
MRIELSYLAPDRYHIVNPGSTEMIVIGKDTYIKAAGKWSKVPVNLGDSIPNIRDSFTEEALKTLKNVEFSGQDSVDGKDAYVYTYSGDTVAKSNNYTSKLWVGKDSGLPLKMEVDYKGGPVTHMTTIYDYDTKVTIDPPAGS